MDLATRDGGGVRLGRPDGAAEMGAFGMAGILPERHPPITQRANRSRTCS
jgi:hypothetical protein